MKINYSSLFKNVYIQQHLCMHRQMQVNFLLRHQHLNNQLDIVSFLKKQNEKYLILILKKKKSICLWGFVFLDGPAPTSGQFSEASNYQGAVLPNNCNVFCIDFFKIKTEKKKNISIKDENMPMAANPTAIPMDDDNYGSLRIAPKTNAPSTAQAQTTQHNPVW